VQIKTIQVQTSKKDSEPFFCKFFKDPELTKLIAEVENGAIFAANDVIAGEISDMRIIPTDTRVQRYNTKSLFFNIEHDLAGAAGVKVRFPYELTLKDDPPKVEIVTDSGKREVQSTFTGEQNEIMIPDVGLEGEVIPAGTQMQLNVHDIKNQDSAKDAGDWMVHTYIKWGDNYYLVDEGRSETSFIAQTGKIDPEPNPLTTPGAQPITIDNPTNSAVNAEYTFKFKLEDSIPASGYLRIDFPELVTMRASTTQSTGSCI
jgi:hypothetical protein